MTPPPPDQSRDRRIEDLTNLWLVHPAGRRLLPWFVARGISANAVSLGGLVLGALAAAAYSRWDSWPFAVAGLLLSIGWLIADGLDGMIARATGTASALGRALDGLCDHGVFVLIYVVLAWSVGTAGRLAAGVGGRGRACGAIQPLRKRARAFPSPVQRRGDLRRRCRAAIRSCSSTILSRGRSTVPPSRSTRRCSGHDDPRRLAAGLWRPEPRGRCG